MRKKTQKDQKASSKEDILDKIKKTQERLIVSLAAAWETAPDDPKIREKLMKASEKAVKLRESIYKDVLKEEPPDVRESYTNLREKLEKEIKDRK
ncbi:hypothetical protein JXA63_00990 [Candidatus Woesebacteria bacterium]|nr:hypothetical protein [Candidatus Woesebacteria bacterium]